MSDTGTEISRSKQQAEAKAPNTRVLAVHCTDSGERLSHLLPYESSPGPFTKVIPELWNEVDGFVLFLSLGAAVRIVSPLLTSKHEDPAIVCVDESGRYVVSLLGGHHGRHNLTANQLAKDVARYLDATPVVTTATDAVSSLSLDSIPGLNAYGPISKVTVEILNGTVPYVCNPMGWPLPEVLRSLPEALPSYEEGTSDENEGGDKPARRYPLLLITDETQNNPGERTVLLRPPSLVIGLGASSQTTPDEVAESIDAAMSAAGLSRESVTEIATIDRRASDKSVLSLGWPVRSYSASELNEFCAGEGGKSIQNPSDEVAQHVGTPSVSEAAALLAAGAGARLVAPKHKSPNVTVAIARRKLPRGKLKVVGLGPGSPDLRAPRATMAIRSAEVVVGYGPYVEMCADLLTGEQIVVKSPIGAELERVGLAVEEAARGRSVVLLASGDPGVFALAAPVIEMAAHEGIDVEVIPGVTASLAVSAILGAPLSHDHAIISLSDLTTPWDEILERVEAAAKSDMAIALYNPRSEGRQDNLETVRLILMKHREAATPVGLVTNAEREGQEIELTTLGKLDTTSVGMTSCLIVGSSTTHVAAGRMVTPRGRTVGKNPN